MFSQRLVLPFNKIGSCFHDGNLGYCTILPIHYGIRNYSKQWLKTINFYWNFCVSGTYEWLDWVVLAWGLL